MKTNTENRNQLSRMRQITYVPDCAGNMGDWKGRHLAAVLAPTGPERPIVNLLRAWLDYASEHYKRYDDNIGDDGVLGQEWAKIGAAIRGLLNGESGRLDCGTLDSLITHNLAVQGIDPDGL